jgi:hypothetical protein
MVTNQQFYEKYGDPMKPEFIREWLVMWDVPPELEIGVIPRRIYCNRDIIIPLSKAFNSLIGTAFVKELKTWDGCYNARAIRGYEERYKQARKAKDIISAMRFLSVHSWGCAVDVNAFENGLGTKGKISPGFVKCFKDAGFDWGGDFKGRKDPMHMQLARI